MPGTAVPGPCSTFAPVTCSVAEKGAGITLRQHSDLLFR